MKTKADILKSENAGEVFEWLKANGEDKEVVDHFSALLKESPSKGLIDYYDLMKS